MNFLVPFVIYDHSWCFEAIALFTVSFSHLHYNVYLTWARGNFGLKLQNSPKLPHIHARLYCNANEKTEPWKGLFEKERAILRTFKTPFVPINHEMYLRSYVFLIGQWRMHKYVIECNRVFSRDVTAAKLVFPNNEMAAMLVYPTDPPGIELYYHTNVFFCFGGKTSLLTMWVKTLYRG